MGIIEICTILICFCLALIFGFYRDNMEIRFWGCFLVGLAMAVIGSRWFPHSCIEEGKYAYLHIVGSIGCLVAGFLLISHSGYVRMKREGKNIIGRI